MNSDPKRIIKRRQIMNEAKNNGNGNDSQNFDLEKLRFRQDFTKIAGVKKALISIAVRKPHRQEFIRVRSGEDRERAEFLEFYPRKLTSVPSSYRVERPEPGAWSWVKQPFFELDFLL